MHLYINELLFLVRLIRNFLFGYKTRGKLKTGNMYIGCREAHASRHYEGPLKPCDCIPTNREGIIKNVRFFFSLEAFMIIICMIVILFMLSVHLLGNISEVLGPHYMY